MEKTYNNHLYEISIFEDNYKKIKEVYENPKTLLDDPNGEEIYWVNKFIKEAQIDIMTSGRIGKGILDAIMTLPEKLQEVIITQSVLQANNSNGYISLVENDINKKISEDKSVKLMLNTMVGVKKEND